MMKRLATLLAVLLVTGCSGGGTDVVAPPVLTTLTVALSAQAVQVGQSVTASAMGTDQNGAPIATGPVTWSSSGEVTVAQDGRVTAVAPGQATIVATAGGKTGQALLTVTALPATAVVLTTPPPSTAQNRTPFAQQPAVQLVNARGAPVAQAGVVVTATVSSGSLAGAVAATTDARGIATFSGLTLTGTAGEATLTFAAPGLTAATAPVVLTAGAAAQLIPMGGTQQTATAGTVTAVAPSIRVTDADGNPVAGVPVLFEVTGGSGTITGASTTTNASGVATVGSWTLGTTGLNTLFAHVVGSPFGVSITATATPPAPVLTTLTVTVQPSTIQMGATAQATVVGVDQFGAPVATGAVVWSATGPATISQTGVVTAIGPGQATILASAGGKTAQATLTITAPVPVLTTLTVAASPGTIQVGGTSQVVAFGRDQFGADIATGPVVWTSTPAATVTQAGVVTGVSAGTATLTATAGGVSASTVITVTPAPVVPVLTTLSVTVTPATIQVGELSSAAAFGKDQFGSDIATGPVVWSATGAVTISPAGVITGVSAGQGIVTATAGGTTAQTTITVSAPPPATPVLTSLSFSLNPSSIAVGGTTQATVAGRDQFGQAIATGPVVWSATGAATVSQTGLITGVSAGQATITAMVGSISSSGTVTVTAVQPPPPVTPVLTSLVVTLAPNPLYATESAQATVAGFDQYGAPIATGAVTFSSPNTFNGDILVTPEGKATILYESADSSIIVARAGSVTGEAVLRVKRLTTLTLSVTPSTILVGDTAQATIVALDQFGAPYNLPIGFRPNCTFQTNCTGAVTITGSRQVIGVAEGRVTLSAFGPSGRFSNPGKTVSVDVHVEVPPYLAGFDVTVPPTVAVGQTVHIDVQGKDQNGRPFPGGQVEYYVVPTEVATVTQFGDLTGVSPGTAIVYIATTTPRSGRFVRQYNITVPGTPNIGVSVNAPPAGVVATRAVFPVQPLVQLVNGTTGAPRAEAGITITAALTSGAGTLLGTTTMKTDGNGRAQFAGLSIRGTSGPKTITFTANGGPTTTWQLTLGPTTPTIVTLNGGNNQTAAAGSLVPVGPSVLVTDVDGNPVSGVAVNFVVTAGGGSVTPSATATTDANGIAQVGWRLGAAGANTLRATAAGIATGVTFSATATP